MITLSDDQNEVLRLRREAQKLREWCKQPWLSSMDRARYTRWAEAFERKAEALK